MARPKVVVDADRAKICALWINGTTAKVLAKEFNCSDNTIRAILKEAGVTRASRKGAGTTVEDKAKAAASIAAYEAIDQGDPNDPLDSANWLFFAAVIAAKRVALDPNYPGTESERSAEMLKYAATAQKLMPVAALRKARKALRQDAKDIEQGQGPKVVKVVKKKPRRSRRRVPGK